MSEIRRKIRNALLSFDWRGYGVRDVKIGDKTDEVLFVLENLSAGLLFLSLFLSNTFDLFKATAFVALTINLIREMRFFDDRMAIYLNLLAYLFVWLFF